MPRTLLTILSTPLSLVGLGATPALAQTPLEVGDDLPPVVLEGLSQTEARSYSEFCGRAVLLEFFAHWCPPCAASVPHLNELQEEFGPRGLSVVAVTSDSARKTEPWIEKHGVEYAYGYDSSGELSRLFQVKGIPFAALIDPFGTVVWTGHPLRLTDEQIEIALPGAHERPAWQWPEEARPLAGMLERSEFAAAMKLASELSPQEGFDPQAIVRGRFTRLLERFTKLVEGREYADALRLGARLEKGLATLPEAEPLAARLRELRDDPEVTRQVAAAAAAERLAALEARASAVRGPAEAEKLRLEVATFVKEQAGQKLERRAQALLDALDRALERAKKKS